MMAVATVDASTALVIIDVQQGMFERPLWRAGVTENCVDSVCRAAVALGYQVTLLSDAHSTFDSPILAHHNGTQGGGFVALSRTDGVMLRSE